MAGRSPWGRITIWDAAADGDLEKVIQRLESNNYHLDGQDSNGKTALMEASRWGHLNVKRGNEKVEFLVNKGANLKLQTGDGASALHIAAEGGHNGVVSFLVQKGADVNLPDVGGNTPLISAVGRKQSSTVKLLISLGANSKIKNRNNKTAFDLAPNSDVMDALRGEEYQSPTQY